MKMPRREVDTSKAKCRVCGGPYEDHEPTYSIANVWDETIDDKDVLLEFEHWKCHTPIEKLFDDARDLLKRAEGSLDKLRKRGL
jgi:hypothetical protein